MDAMCTTRSGSGSLFPVHATDVFIPASIIWDTSLLTVFSPGASLEAGGTARAAAIRGMDPEHHLYAGVVEYSPVCQYQYSRLTKED